MLIIQPDEESRKALARLSGLPPALCYNRPIANFFLRREIKSCGVLALTMTYASYWRIIAG